MNKGREKRRKKNRKKKKNRLSNGAEIVLGVATNLILLLGLT